VRIAILGFLLGVTWLQMQPALPSSVALLALAALAGVGLVDVARRPVGQFHSQSVRTVTMQCVAGVAAALLGAGYASLRGEVRLAEELPREWESREVEIVGVVNSLPQQTERGVRFEFEIESAKTQGAALPRHVSLNWYSESGSSEPDRVGDFAHATTHSTPRVAPGERWHFTVRLRRPHGTQNPHGFDFEAWALERNLRATGYVRPKGANTREATPASGFGHGINRARLAIRDAMLAQLGDRPYAGVLVALVIGQQNAIPSLHWRDFWRTGTGHLMSISGLHITMVASLIYWLVFRIWANSPGLPRRIPAQRAAAIGGAAAALAYSLLAGFSVPTQRTFYMLATVAVLLCTGRAISGSRVLAIALAVVVVADPWAVLAPGLWLSFGALAAILYVVHARSGIESWWWIALRTQAAVTVGLAPLSLGLFQEVSLVSPLANAFAIPVVSWLVVPLALLGALVDLLFGFGGLLLLSHAIMGECHGALAWMAGFDQAVWQSHAPAGWSVVLAIVATLWLLAPRGIPGRWVAPALLAPMFALKPQPPVYGDFEVRVLDVGQGHAAVVRTATRALVFDTGPTWNPDADSGSRIVVPYLRGEGMSTLETLIVSHADDDHSGGAASVIAARNPKWVMSSMADDHPAIATASEHLRCEAGDSWRWDGVDFDILHPASEDYDRNNTKTNNMGCVLKVSGSGGSILFTADIEQLAERALVARYRNDPDQLRADVIVVPHHGSRTSSTEALLDAVGANVALLPVGYRNRFRHPNAQVMERYAARGIKVYRTDESGALRVRFGAMKTRPIQVDRYREDRRRYWIAPPERGGGE
jgi:competence protein ComEC